MDQTNHFFNLGYAYWMARDTQGERLVDAAIDVGELDVERVDRRGQRHAVKTPNSRRR